ncbi:MAG: hypothetical protein M3Q27_14435 [Actinomycetota bacterium]|nr:hypothetical protein [Actinomycetota bacterium]
MRALLGLLRGRGERALAALREEVERLREENARLRLDAQRPLHLLTVAETVRSLSDAPAPDAADEMRHELAELMTIRTGWLAVLRDLQTAGAQLERRLSLGTPSSEIDRRVREPKQAARTAGTATASSNSMASGWTCLA